jgi:hypothetical protein
MMSSSFATERSECLIHMYTTYYIKRIYSRSAGEGLAHGSRFYYRNERNGSIP